MWRIQKDEENCTQYSIMLSASVFCCSCFVSLLRLSTLNINGHFTGCYTERDNAIHSTQHNTAKYIARSSAIYIITTKVWVRHSFLKYKWAVNNVMMPSCSIYSYMICWLGFHLYGTFYFRIYLSYGQVSHSMHNGCSTLFWASCSYPFSWAQTPCECMNPPSINHTFIQFKCTH